MIIAVLLILGASLLFLTIAFVAVVFCIVLPMHRELAEAKAKQADQEDTIARNADATIGLYFAGRREINALKEKVESRATSSDTEEGAPITIRSARDGVPA